MKEKIEQLKVKLEQIEKDLVDTRIDLGEQEIFVLHERARLRKKIAELEK